MKKIFLLGSERSGSNLLRTLLGNHSQISAPIAPHLCDVFYNRIHLYLPFNELNLSHLYSDLETYLNHEFNDWKITFNKEEIIKKYNPKSFLEVYDSVFTEKALQKNKSTYFSKDNHLHSYALGLKMKLKDVYFIHLCRDPRDQVASWMRTPIYLYTPYQAITKWIHEQNACLTLEDFYGLPVHTIRYEDLINKPAETMSAALQYLNLPIEENCFQTRSDNKEADKHLLWKNINKPILSGNHEKYKDILTEEDVHMIEHLCDNLMERFGYTRESQGAWKAGSLFKYSEKIKARRSYKKFKTKIEGEMKVLSDKQKLIQNIFSARAGR